MVVSSVCHDYLICINKAELRVDLLLLSLYEFDVILGMDWLTKHHAIVNCFEKLVKFKRPCVISTIVAEKLLRKGYQAYLAYVVDKELREPKIEHVSIVYKFLNVFLEELPKLSPDK